MIIFINLFVVEVWQLSTIISNKVMVNYFSANGKEEYLW